MRFIFPKHLFDSPLNNDQNSCYNIDSFHGRQSGLLNMHKCFKIKSLFVSHPHFLFANRFIINSVTGLKPNMTNHLSYLNIDPVRNVIFRQ